MFPHEDTLRTILLVLSAFTMLFGSFGAIARDRWRYSLSFANIASIGYLLMGAMTGNLEGLSAAFYYLINSVLVIFSLFLIAALAEYLAGPDYHAAGHLRFYPWLAVGFFIVALALAGIPPTSGFIGKYALISALFENTTLLQSVVAVVAITSGFLLLYASIKIWRNFFWGEHSRDAALQLPLGMSSITAVAVVLVIMLTLGSNFAYNTAQAAALQLQNQDLYIKAVLGGN
jgi:multicomponent Na+:H+ antiporter subunit D